MDDIHQYIKQRETEKLNDKIAEIEITPRDSQKMFKVIKQLSRQKQSNKSLIMSKYGLTADEQNQADIIADHFRKQFHRDHGLLEYLDVQRESTQKLAYA